MIKYNKLFFMKTKKAQVISMDLIMTFVIYLFVLSIFLFFLGDTIGSQNNEQLKPELILNKLNNIFINDYKLIKNSKIINIENFENKYDEQRSYDIFFREFDNQKVFKKIDYCLFLSKKTENGIRILKDFASYRNGTKGYSIYFNDIPCGQLNNLYMGLPYCITPKSDSVLMKKSVLFNDEIVDFNVLSCAQKR
jgi:hypothetical protein